MAPNSKEVVMSELKVRDAPHLVRRNRAPGVLVNTNQQGYQAARKARQNMQEMQDVKAELDLLRELIQTKFNGGE